MKILAFIASVLLSGLALAGDAVLQFDKATGQIGNATNLLFRGSGAFEATVSAADPTNQSDLVTLHYLDRALGSISTLYASTNQDLGIAGYYDARTFLPTHAAATISVAGVTNNQYVGQWVSNTNLIANIRNGIGVVIGRMRLNSPTAGKTLVVKPEVYRRTVADGDIEMYEISENITLDGTMTEYESNVDCPSNTVFSATDRVVVKWRVVSQTGNPTWYFECGTPYIIAARFPVSLGGGADAVTIGTVQTVTGAKTFTGSTTLGPVTRTGTDDYAGNNVTNVGRLDATNANMNGNIILNSNYLSGDGGNEGVSVSASGWVGLNTTSPSAHLHIVAATNGSSSSPVVIDSYGGTFDVFSGITFRKARGTVASPSALVSGDAVFAFGGRGYGASAFSSGGRAQVSGITDENWTDSDQGASVTITTCPTNTATQNTRFRFTGAGNFQINANNGNLIPATIAGSVTYFVTNATSARALVKRGDGTVTLISPHNDQGEYVADSWNDFSGVHEIVNISKLGQAIESILPVGHPLKGKIYSAVTNAPQEDWRANEARLEAQALKAQLSWTPDSGAFPATYIKRPMPPTIAPAQRVFDYKYPAEAEK